MRTPLTLSAKRIAALCEPQALSRREREARRDFRYACSMFSILNYPELIERALQDAAWTAKHGTREEKSGKFLPPPGWKGRLVTADDAPRTPRKKRA